MSECRCDDPMHYNCVELRQWWEEAKGEIEVLRAAIDGEPWLGDT